MTTVMFSNRNSNPAMISDSRITTYDLDGSEIFGQCNTKVYQFENHLFGFAGRANLVSEFFAWWARSQVTGYYTPYKTMFSNTTIMENIDIFDSALDVLVYNPEKNEVEHFRCVKNLKIYAILYILGLEKKCSYKYKLIKRYANATNSMFIGSGSIVAKKAYDTLLDQPEAEIMTDEEFYKIIFKVVDEYDEYSNSDIKIRKIEQDGDCCLMPV